MRLRRLFLVAYLASGAAGLLYEVAWARLLTLYLGHGIAAVSTVLAAFMGGLAAGAAVGGRVAPRLTASRALRVYAVLEAAVGALALALPVTLGAGQPLLARVYNSAGPDSLAFGLARVAACVLIVALPAVLMGATFPLAVRWYSRNPDLAGREAGGLYATNTVGACAGATLTGFVLLPLLGLRLTTIAGLVLNVTAAALAWWIAGFPIEDAGPVPTRPRARAHATTPTQSTMVSAPATARLMLAAGALVLSGFVALTYEVTFTRLLALIIGPTTYAFALLLGAFIGGLAMGAAAGARWATIRNPLAAVGLTLLVTALGGLLVAGLAGDLPLLVAQLVAQPGWSFSALVWFEAVILVALLLPATFALGAAFPFAVAAAAGPTRSVARDAAIVYSANTLGAIAGALASGFVLVPALGLRTSILTVALAAAGGGLLVVVAARASRAQRLLALALAASTAVAVWSLPAWNRALLSSGAYKYAPYLSGADMQTALEAGSILYYAEGATGTVTVRQSGGTLSLAIDGKIDASNAGDMLTQKLLAHVPLLLHASPRTVGIIGLGSGVTLGAALRHPVERADAIEISPEVVQASRFFAKDNGGALGDGRTRLILGDARAHLSLGRDRYDVIISEPSNPWMAGVASLFTREFFEVLRGRLEPGGVLCQWAHTYDISDADLRSIAATFLSVFPQGMLWLVGDGDVLLVAGQEPPDILLARVLASWQRPGVAGDLASVGVRSPFALLSQFVASGQDLRDLSVGAALQTDDRMALEFSAPREIYGATRADNATRLRELAARARQPDVVRQALASATTADWKERGLMMLQAEAPRVAYGDLARAASRDPGDRETLEALERAAAGAQRVEDALALLATLAQAPGGRVTAPVAASRLLASTGRIENAVEMVGRALAIVADDPGALAQQASIFADAGDLERLEPAVRRLETVAPNGAETLYYGATLAFMSQQADKAIRLAQRAVATDPRHARAHNLLGAALASLGKVDEARQAFQTSLELNPKDATPYTNLGSLELLDAANPSAAVGHFSEALALDPGSSAARDGLVRALEATGNHARAARLRAR